MTAPTLTPTDLRHLKRQIVSATTVYRAAHAAADEALSVGNPRAERLVGIAAAAERKRDALLDQWPRG